MADTEPEQPPGLQGLEAINESLHTPVDISRTDARMVVLTMARTREEMLFSLYEQCVAMLAARNWEQLLNVQKAIISMQGWDNGMPGAPGGPGPNDPPFPTPPK